MHFIQFVHQGSNDAGFYLAIGCAESNKYKPVASFIPISVFIPGGLCPTGAVKKERPGLSENALERGSGFKI